MKIQFEVVDAGCSMFENEHGRWIIEHPRGGYMKTVSQMWDVLVEHPENPHSIPVKFLGSFQTKRQARQHLGEVISHHTFESATSVENEFYGQDYRPK